MSASEGEADIAHATSVRAEGACLQSRQLRINVSFLLRFANYLLAWASGMKLTAMSFLHTVKRRMAPVLDLDPVFRPAALIRPVTMLGYQALSGTNSRSRIWSFMPATEEQLSTKQSRQDKRERFRRRLIVGVWVLTLAVSMTGWLVALAWIAYLLIRRLVS